MLECVDGNESLFPSTLTPFYSGNPTPQDTPKINENQLQLIWDVTCMVMASHKYNINFD